MNIKLIWMTALLGVMVYGAGCSSSENSAGVSNTTPPSGHGFPEAPDNSAITTLNDLGALPPEAALEYMKAAENLVIVDVASRANYGRIHFEGAVNIPIEDLDTLGENAMYMDIPGGRPVILHCRRGVIVPGAYTRLKELRPDIPEISYIAGTPLFEQYNEWLADRQNGNQQRLLGGQSPADALEYMKNTPNLVIVEVNNPEWKMGTGFTGSIHIPYTEMAERHTEIPQDRPVLLYCGGGIVSVEAYGILREKRPDIPELSYVSSRPLVSLYNEWLAAWQ
ncbi:rhodanese-like domain-containing protein [Breznakiella homolactica]|uniref:Rhodanese domain-containing protein n=1 Tax=Breznakiella homolactica TaxID=2798577 RepID=A0A7T8B8Q4_9SPIR|nr:rhodanese-like domain-containing protein [Breznakiella homolactica]QQO07622.1 hypothetical protein JFL75_11760 [Breznakiella homolactica]